MSRFHYDEYRDCLAAEIRRLAAAVQDADPRTPVPTCPAWTLDQLIEHVGHIHRWATAIVGKLSARRLDRQAADWPLPPDPADYPAWLLAGGRGLLEVLHNADPDAAVWVWGGDPYVRWWGRRMLHETTIHRCDAELALGAKPRLDPDTALDGVDEFLTNLSYAAPFAPGVRDLRGDGERMRLSCLDEEVDWTITLTGDGFRWSHDDENRPVDTQVDATATDLYLLVWRRRDLDDPRVEVRGKHAVAENWMARSAI